MRRRYYRRAIARIANLYQMRRMITLTVDPKLVPPGVDPLDYIGHCWDKFKAQLHWYYRLPIVYLRIIEWQTRGLPHYHVLVSATFDEGTMRRLWTGVGGGYQVTVRYLDGGRAPAYVSKYLTKDAKIDLPAGLRPVTSSSGITLHETKPKSDWRWSPQSIELHHAFNDPDAFLLREENGELSYFEGTQGEYQPTPWLDDS